MPAPSLRFKRGASSTIPPLKQGEPAFTTDTFDLYIGADSTLPNNKFFGSHRYWKKETSNTGSSVKLVEGTSYGNNYVALKSPNSLSNNLTFVLPNNYGSPNTLLSNDGLGNLSWVNALNPSGINTFTNTEESYSTTTGALVVYGGVGIGKNLNIGGNVNITGIVTANSYYGDGSNLSGVTAVDLTIETLTESIVYPLFANNLGVSTISIDQSNFVYYPNQNLVGIGTSIPQANLDVRGNFIATSATLTANADPLTDTYALSLTGSVSSNSSNHGLLGIGTLGFEDTDVIANFSHNVDSYAQFVIQNKNSGSYASADIVINNDRLGGASNYGNFGINGSGYGPDDIFSDPNGTYLYSSGGTLTIGTLNGYDFKVGVNNIVTLRIDGPTAVPYFGYHESTISLTNPFAIFTYDVNDYSQMQIQNLSDGSLASVDYIASTDTASDDSEYIDLGINGSGYITDGLWSAKDGYLYVHAPHSGEGGNLVLGTKGGVGKDVIIHIDGTDVENEKVRITSVGVGIGTSVFSSALHVEGDTIITGDLTVKGTTTSIDVNTLNVKDSIIDLGLVDDGTGNLIPPSSDANIDLGVIFNYYTISAKKSGIFWDDSTSRIAIASDLTEASSIITANSYADLVIKSLWINDCAGESEVITCSGSTRELVNIEIDGGFY